MHAQLNFIFENSQPMRLVTPYGCVCIVHHWLCTEVSAIKYNIFFPQHLCRELAKNLTLKKPTSRVINVIHGPIPRLCVVAVELYTVGRRVRVVLHDRAHLTKECLSAAFVVHGSQAANSHVAACATVIQESQCSRMFNKKECWHCQTEQFCFHSLSNGRTVRTGHKLWVNHRHVAPILDYSIRIRLDRQYDGIHPR